MMLTPHFSLMELTVSEVAARRGIDNSPPPAVLRVLRETAQQMEKMRALLGYPIIVTSGYRSPALNQAVGGVNSSAHLTGHAVDFVCPKFGTPFDVATAVKASKIEFDQLILEYGWVHISFDPQMRGECLTRKSATSPYRVGLIP